MSKRLVIFNHKGGVSKTTSAYNIGWMLSRDKRVLLVDADPQCNLSGLILRDEFEKYYLDESTKLDNIKDGVSPAFDGKPIPLKSVSCFSPARAENLYLLAGHANLSEYDAALTFAQTSNNAITTLQNLPGAFSELLKLTEERYGIDYTIIDLNPGLSAINQNFFLISDAFLIPTNSDPFSVMALDTLQSVLPRWVRWKRDSVRLFSQSAYPLPEGAPKLIGSLVQRFNIRNGRAARPYRENIDEINEKISGTFFEALNGEHMTFNPQEYGDLVSQKYCLGLIPDFQGLLPKSHEAGVPIFELRNAEISETGHVLAGFIERQEKFKVLFSEICQKIEDLLQHA